MSPKKLKEPRLENPSINQLHFDPENPRLPEYIDGENENQILEWMLGDASLIELMGSIGEQGYFPGEPLLGYQRKDGIYIVVEGNRRLAATKLLHSPDKAPSHKKTVQAVSSEASNKPLTLPMFVYPTRNEILTYLGYRHVTGIKPWDPLAKARYLKQLFEMQSDKGEQAKYKVLAKKIGSRADYVARLLAGYALYEKIANDNFFGIKGLDEGSIDFSVLTTATNYSNIYEFLGLESSSDPSLKGLKPENLKNLVSWIFEKSNEGKSRVGESRNLSVLNKIVENKKALKAWEDGASLENAAMLTEAPMEIFKTSIMQSQSNLDLARSYSHLVDKPEQTFLEILRDIKRIAGDLHSVLQGRLDD
ncbi:MAG TPA: ParB/Srx family N-terminal domain-containing protein [Anaerolineales bacterium]|nr:ParB/Srx family N-terminal domain-containing protein [Anaerolineales bacterium]